MKETAKDSKKAIKGAYKVFQQNPSAITVLDDLKKECRFTQTTFSKDPLDMARLNGKREVILYIEDMINDSKRRIKE